MNYPMLCNNLLVQLFMNWKQKKHKLRCLQMSLKHVDKCRYACYIMNIIGKGDYII